MAALQAWLRLALVLLICVFARTAGADPGRQNAATEPCRGEESEACAAERRAPTGLLSLADALALAVESSPELEAFSWELRARDAAALQAGVRANPELSLELENLGSSGLSRGLAESETTLGFRIPIERGGKRAKRTAVAKLDRRLAEWDYAAKRLDVLAETSRAFSDVLAAQQRVALARQFVEMARAESDAVRRRVELGGASAVERNHAEVALATSRLEEQLAQRKLAAARSALAANWGSQGARFSEARGEFWSLEALPDPEGLERRAEAAPEMRRWESELEQRRAALALAESERLPDMELHAGVRRLAEEGENALVFEMSSPLALFDRNQGAIEQSEFAVRKLASERNAARLQLRKELAAAYEALALSHEESRALKEEVIPLAEAAYAAAREAYRVGRFRYVEVIDAQRSLFELRGRQIDALAAYHGARADLSRVLGSSSSALVEQPGAEPAQLPMASAGEVP